MPSDEGLEQARRFIADHIGSVAQLELLLLLRTTAMRRWTVEDLSRELRIEPAWAHAQLIPFCDIGLVRCHEAASEKTYTYDPARDDLRDLITAVAQAYLLHRVSVIELIYGKPTQSIRAFADAFKFRKEPPRG
jgi:hypothetical protein